MDSCLRFVRRVGEDVEICDVVARFVAMGVLANQTCDVGWRVGRQLGARSEDAVEFCLQCVAAPHHLG